MRYFLKNIFVLHKLLVTGDFTHEANVTTETENVLNRRGANVGRSVLAAAPLRRCAVMSCAVREAALYCDSANPAEGMVGLALRLQSSWSCTTTYENPSAALCSDHVYVKFEFNHNQR